jgi:hypothetical protein
VRSSLSHIGSPVAGEGMEDEREEQGRGEMEGQGGDK